MTAIRIARGAALALWLSALAAGALAQAQPGAKPYAPQPGEQGKDVMWLPSGNVMVGRMLNLAQVTAKDYVLDLGSGDGRTVIAAARRGARALGVEYNPDLVEYSRRMAEKARVGDRARFVQGDLFAADLSQATVITLFLLDEINLKLRPKLLALKPGTRIVSNSFTMGDWPADRTATASAKEGCTDYCIARLWIVPARVEGRWRTRQGELTLEQNYQAISGTLNTGVVEIAVKGRMRGDEIAFTAGPRHYKGRVKGDSINGTVGSSRWTATRSGQP